ncbi:unnamed protein product [Cyprideis torosa]|uniref:Helicase ATP-binding domain-containing protein n=1 Tax=Cyprideis torosa TaxID=163714 RepID=A0A7R8W5Z5_9CRUS|nr:unnamed protein product [Cyprideis torosa]CAG0885841.1 unnamed protein product [Cyprideis torosa]
MFRAFKRLLPVSDGDDDDDDLPVGGRGEAAGPNQGFSAAPPAKKRTALEILTLLSSTPSPSGTESSVDSNVNQPSLSNVKRKQLGGGGRRLGLHGGSTVPSAKTESINKEISCERETDIYGALEDDLSPCPTVSSSAETANATGVERRVFDVLWCKASKKKHKNWEGDAFLTVEGRSAFLKDMSGKEIGRCIGYKVAQLAELTEGSRLLVGGKEVEHGPADSADLAEVWREIWLHLSGMARLVEKAEDRLRQEGLEDDIIKSERSGLCSRAELYEYMASVRATGEEDKKALEQGCGQWKKRETVVLVKRQNSPTMTVEGKGKEHVDTKNADDGGEGEEAKVDEKRQVMWSTNELIMACTASVAIVLGVGVTGYMGRQLWLKKRRTGREEEMEAGSPRSTPVESPRGGTEMRMLREDEEGTLDRDVTDGNSRSQLYNKINDMAPFLMSERSVPASTVEVESGTSDSLRRHAQKPLRPLQNASGGRRPMGGSYLRAGLSTSRAPSSLTAVGSGRIPAFTAPQRTDEGGKEEAQEEEEFVLCPPPAHLCYRDSNSQPRTVTVDRHLSRSLRPHQKEGLRFLYNVMAGFIPEVRGAILADEMGLGKTLQTIALIWTLLRQGPYGSPLVQRALVIAPSGLLKNWSNEFNKWLGRERILVHLVSQNVKPSRLVLTPSVPVMLISYEMALKYVQDLETFNFDLIVCDEGHRLKNANVKIFAALSSLRCRRRLVLTGTPVQNDIREFFTLVDFVNPGILQSLNMPRSALESCLRNPVSADGGSGAEDDTDEDENESCRHKLSRLVSSFLLRRTLESTLGNQLPPRTVAVVFCHPSPLQSNLYQAVLDSRESQVIQNMDVGVSSGNVLRILTLLKKLCNHPILINSECLEGVSFPSSFNQSFPRPNDSGKLVALCRLLDFLFISPEKPEPPPERIVLVSNYTKTLDVLESICQSKGLSSLRLDGTTPIADRQKLVDRFNDPASRDREFLTTGTIEERIFQRQLMKGALSGLVENTVSRGSVNSLEQCLLEKPHFGLDTSPKFSQDELKDLFSLVSDSNCLTHDLMDCQCSTKVGSASKISRSRLDQLMDWKHLESTDVEVSHLGLESEQVSFVMLNHQTI